MKWSEFYMGSSWEPSEEVRKIVVGSGGRVMKRH